VAANHLVPVLQRGEAIDAAVLQRIQDERMPEIHAVQAGQTRAGQMVLKPMAAMHVMFTILLLAMKMVKKLRSGSGLSPPQPRYLAPAAAAG